MSSILIAAEDGNHGYILEGVGAANSVETILLVLLGT